MKKLAVITALAIALGSINNLSAAPRWSNNDSHIARAKVVSVTPIYETVEVARPDKRCWQEPVQRPPRHHGRFSGPQSYTGPIAGAIAGGVIGNQFGKGNGKDAMTVAGAVLGASIGNDLTRVEHRPDRRHHGRFEQRCETVTQYESHKELVAYDVKYRFRGQTYRTRMEHDPGDSMQVRVTVNPVM